jgi:hypothetical protein
MADNWALDLARVHAPRNGQANLFGVVIYTAKHPHVRKLLQDKVYWEALNAVSGPYWTVFAAVAESGAYKMPPPSPGRLAMLVPVWKEPSANRELLEAFELASTENPVLVVFAQAESGSVFRRAIAIEDSSEPAAYASLSTALEVIHKCIGRMDPQYRPLETRAFRLVDSDFQNKDSWRLVRRTISFYAWLKGLA